MGGGRRVLERRARAAVRGEGGQEERHTGRRRRELRRPRGGPSVQNAVARRAAGRCQMGGDDARSGGDDPPPASPPPPPTPHHRGMMHPLRALPCRRSATAAHPCARFHPNDGRRAARRACAGAATPAAARRGGGGGRPRRIFGSGGELAKIPVRPPGSAPPRFTGRIGSAVEHPQSGVRDSAGPLLATHPGGHASGRLLQVASEGTPRIRIRQASIGAVYMRACCTVLYHPRTLPVQARVPFHLRVKRDGTASTRVGECNLAAVIAARAMPCVA